MRPDAAGLDTGAKLNSSAVEGKRGYKPRWILVHLYGHKK